MRDPPHLDQSDPHLDLEYRRIEMAIRVDQALDRALGRETYALASGATR